MAKFFKKLILILSGIALLLFVTILGIYLLPEQGLSLSFTLAVAILVPIGILLIQLGVTEESRRKLAELEKVPEIGELIERAKTQEGKITALEEEGKRILEKLELQSKLVVLGERKKVLALEANRLVSEIRRLENEIQLEGGEKEVEIKSLYSQIKALRTQLLNDSNKNIIKTFLHTGIKSIYHPVVFVSLLTPLLASLPSNITDQSFPYGPPIESLNNAWSYAFFDFRIQHLTVTISASLLILMSISFASAIPPCKTRLYTIFIACISTCLLLFVFVAISPNTVASYLPDNNVISSKLRFPPNTFLTWIRLTITIGGILLSIITTNYERFTNNKIEPISDFRHR